MQQDTKSSHVIRKFANDHFGPDVKGRLELLMSTFPFVPNPFTLYFDSFLPILKKSRSILDAGCSRGIYTSSLSGKRIIGVDSDPHEIREANIRKINKKADYRTADLFSLPAMKPFETILCQNVIEHVPDPKKLISIFYDLLDPRGQLLILTPNVHHPLYFLNSRIHLPFLQKMKNIFRIPFNRTPLSYQANTIDRLDALCTASGFTKRGVFTALDTPITIHSPLYVYIWTWVNALLIYFKKTRYFPIIAVIYQKN
jgi:2-polyprenyl-3-methyl-5-hydroxy-6-metoxy-1,4-benzoquinol methylase